MEISPKSATSQSVRNRSGNNICILLRASNRPLDGVKGQKVVKNTFLGGLDPVLDPKFPGPLGFFSLAHEYLEVGEKISHTVNWGHCSQEMSGTFGEKFFGSAPPVSRYFVCSDTTPEGGGVPPPSEGVSFALTKERLELSDPAP